MKARISIISVNYNGFALTAAMIDSLRRHVTTPLEIVVVDNGSARDEAALLRERYPDIVVLRSDENLGFAGAYAVRPVASRRFPLSCRTV